MWVGLIPTGEGFHRKRRTTPKEEGIWPADCPGSAACRFGTCQPPQSLKLVLKSVRRSLSLHMQTHTLWRLWSTPTLICSQRLLRVQLESHLRGSPQTTPRAQRQQPTNTRKPFPVRSRSYALIHSPTTVPHPEVSYTLYFCPDSPFQGEEGS